MNFNDWSEEITKNLKQADDVVRQILKMAGNDNRFTQDSDALKNVVESMVEAQLKSFGIPSKKAHEALLQQLLESQRESDMLWKRIKVLEDKLAAQSEASEPEEFKPAAKRVSQPASVKKVSKSTGTAKPISKAGGGVKTPKAKQPSANKSPASKKTAAKKKPPAKATPDDLTKIKGIGPKLEEKLIAAGLKTFEQLAALSVEEAQTLDEQLGLQGRVLRDDWINQAAELS